MTDVTLTTHLVGDDRSLTKTMRKASDAVEDVGKKSKRTGDVMKGALGAEVVTRLADAVVSFGQDSIDAYRGAEVSQKQLEDAYKRFPNVTSVAIDSLREYNQALQDKGFADADDVASGQAVLARYKLTGQQLKQLTPLLVDYANRTGKDIPTAAAALGKGLSGSSRLAKELGFSFKDAKDPAKNFDQILAGLEGTVGGYSASLPEAERNSKKLANKFGDLQESLGEKLLPLMNKAAEVGLQLVDWISQNVSWLGPLAAGLGVAAGAFMILNAAMAANPIGLVVIAIGALIGGLIYAYQNVKWFRDGVNAAFSAIGAVARWLWNNALAPALRGIVTGFAWVISAVADFLDALGNIQGFGWAKDAAAGLRGVARGAREAADGIKNIPDPKVETSPAKKRVDELKAKIKSVKDRLVHVDTKADPTKAKKLRDELNKLRKQYNVAIRVYKTGISKIAVSAVAGANAGFRISARARGGPVRKGQPYVVGEDGWEVFVPEMNGMIRNQKQLAGAGASVGSGGGVGGSGAMSVLINMQGLPAGPRAFAEAIERELYGLMKSRGPAGKLTFQRA